MQGAALGCNAARAGCTTVYWLPAILPVPKGATEVLSGAIIEST